MIKLEQALEAIRTLRDYCKQTSLDDCESNDCPISKWCIKDRMYLPEIWEVGEPK